MRTLIYSFIFVLLAACSPVEPGAELLRSTSSKLPIVIESFQYKCLEEPNTYLRIIEKEDGVLLARCFKLIKE